MRISIKGLLAACLLACLPMGASAQDETAGGIPPDVFYLMPSFAQGTVVFSGQAPAQGLLNICAEDHSLRFLDNDGQELQAADISNVVRVIIDGVVFVRNGNYFYRIYPVSEGVDVAFLRDLEVLRDVRKGAYGVEDRTSSIREYSAIHSDGVMYKLEQRTNFPYRVYETCYLYKGGSVIPLTKRNLRRQFPDRKADIDAWLKSGHSIPDSLEEVIGFLSRLASGEAL